MSWNKLVCNYRELQLMGTLSGGQSFRWAHDKESNEWIGVFSKTVWKLKENDDHLQYQVIGSLHNKSKTKYAENKVDFKRMLEDYFRLDMNLGEYYKEWSEKDELFKSACQQFYGIRMLRQEPVENLFSFICSQNNHILRISSMVEKLCLQYGEKICEYEGNTYYAFPEVEKLANPEDCSKCGNSQKLAEVYLREHTHFESRLRKSTSASFIASGHSANVQVDSVLRKLGFGYRAKFIQKSACQIVEWGGLEWFRSLQDMKYKDAKTELMKLHGIGPKVADCICLMSLNHLEALPVDTHVYQIAAHNYLPHLRGKKNVTDKMYVEIGDHFRSLYGDLAGWAHTVLFCADLKKFQQNGTSDSEKSDIPKKKRKKV